jgi:hypothetical protein
MDEEPCCRFSSKPTGSFAQNCGQRFAEISGRDHFEVKGWKQGIDAGSPPHVLGQNRTGKVPLVPMMDPWLTNRDRPHSTDQLSLRQMSIAYHQPLSILIPSILVELDIFDHFILDRGL